MISFLYSMPYTARVQQLAVAQIRKASKPFCWAICIPNIKEVPHAHEMAMDVPKYIEEIKRLNI